MGKTQEKIPYDTLLLDAANLLEGLKMAKAIIEEHSPHVLTEDTRGIEIEEILACWPE